MNIYTALEENMKQPREHKKTRGTSEGNKQGGTDAAKESTEVPPFKPLFSHTPSMVPWELMSTGSLSGPVATEVSRLPPPSIAGTVFSS